jgi:acetate kinase
VACEEAKVSAPQSRTQIWVIPTNEELVVARQAAQLLSEANAC